MWLLYADFMRLLSDVGDRWPWWITPAGEIRTESATGHEADPITAMCAQLHHALFDVCDYRIAARLLGLDNDTAREIMRAADLAGSYNAHVRADLIHGCQLAEQWGKEGRWEDKAFHAGPYPHQYDRPYRHGVGLPGFATVAAPRARSKFTSAPASVALRSRLIVRTNAPVPHLSISSGYSATPAASSYAFNVGVSRPGFDFELERMAAD